MSVLVNDGHQNFSTCSTTKSVPAKWLTNGFIRGSYIVSVRSLINATFFPHRTISRIPNGLPSTHMFKCTPIRTTFSIRRERLQPLLLRHLYPLCRQLQTIEGKDTGSHE